MRVTCGQPWPMWTYPCLNSESTSHCWEKSSAKIATSRCGTQPPLVQALSRRVTQADRAVHRFRRGSGQLLFPAAGLPRRNSFSSARRGARSLSCGEPVCAEFPGHGPLDNALAGNSNCQCLPAASHPNISATSHHRTRNFHADEQRVVVQRAAPAVAVCD